LEQSEPDLTLLDLTQISGKTSLTTMAWD